MEAPPGGPVDKSGPMILSCMPEKGAIGIPRDNKVSILFSERVDRRTIETAVFVSPRPEGKLKYDWDGNKLDIILPDSFALNATYIVSVGAAVADLRNNKMEQSFQLAFSTGQTINQGKLEGAVFQNNKPAPNITIGLYDSALIGKETFLDSVYPAYFTQSDKDGKYILDYLSDGDYFLYAFNDKNKNQLFDYPDEDFGLPCRIAKVSSTLSPVINFNLMKHDTSVVKIISAHLTPDHLIKMRLSRPVAGETLRSNLNKIMLFSEADTQTIYYPQSILENDTDTSSSFNLYFGTIINGAYVLKLAASVFDVTLDSNMYSEYNMPDVIVEPDKTAPTIKSVTPSNQTIYPDESELEISFSEPINGKGSGENLIVLTTSANDSIQFNQKWIDDFRLKIIPEMLNWGETYKVTLLESLIVDMSGNRAGDSVKSFSFKTYNADSLGIISGNISYAPELDTMGILYLSFLSMTEKKPFLRATASNLFSYQLMPGKYFLKGFLDKNGNGRQDVGMLKPLQFAEPFFIYPDTIKVRARFETAGLEFQIK
jgi:uncharacterized protein (DUF2141 family)